MDTVFKSPSLHSTESRLISSLCYSPVHKNWLYSDATSPDPFVWIMHNTYPYAKKKSTTPLSNKVYMPHFVGFLLKHGSLITH